jgi:hypothetical protein
MKIKLNDPSQIMSHFVLRSTAVVEALIETEEFKRDGSLIAKVIVNGVEIPADVYEDVLNNLFTQYYDAVRNKYEAPKIDQMVEDKAKELLKQSADNVIETLDDLRDRLQNIDDMIKPYWST